MARAVDCMCSPPRPRGWQGRCWSGPPKCRRTPVWHRPPRNSRCHGHPELLRRLCLLWPEPGHSKWSNALRLPEWWSAQRHLWNRPLGSPTRAIRAPTRRSVERPSSHSCTPPSCVQSPARRSARLCARPRCSASSRQTATLQWRREPARRRELVVMPTVRLLVRGILRWIRTLPSSSHLAWRPALRWLMANPAWGPAMRMAFALARLLASKRGRPRSQSTAALARHRHWKRRPRQARW